MLDNANGGRCICSDKNAEYDAILEEIQKLGEQSYQLATVGVERIEMGDAVDAVMSKTDSVTKRVTADAAKSKRQSLDLSSWNSMELDFDVDAEDIFDISSDGVSIGNKTGDALYRAAAKLCSAQIPECKTQSTLMESMYKQRIRSDCTAYENSLRQSRTQSAQKLYAAQSAMREAALEQYRNANKYDLGQCTVQFKQCMQTTGGCGDDFTGCVEWSVRENLLGNSEREKTIKGTTSKIKLRAETYDSLLAKKDICMTVTQQCVNVRDQVWDAFLREAAPQIKSAELIVESNMRTSCISNISNCFQKACHDTMDPNDPEGSYDMCLTRPETLRSTCKVEIEPCEKAIPEIMTYVSARLKSMRVDSCTNEFKACLQSEDRCGEDYTQCIGLDTDTIVKMCPADKLVGCQYNSNGADNNDYVYNKQDVYDNLAEIVTGIFLNIDNNMLTACQRAADAAMIKVCGSTENCDDLVVDNGAGTRSFKYEVCEYNGFERNTYSSNALNNEYNNAGIASANYVGGIIPKWTGVCYDSLDGISEMQLKHDKTDAGWAGKLSGLIYWGEISYSQNNTTHEFGFTRESDYITAVEQALGTTLSSEERKIIKERVYGTEIRALTSAVENAINAIESDQTVEYCMKGRRFQGLRDKDGTIKQLGTVDTNGNLKSEDARFPNLTSQMRQTIATSALKNARDNYMQKYDEEIQRMMKDQVKAAERIDRSEALRVAAETCKAWAESSVLPASATPEASNAGTWAVIGSLLLVAAAAVATVFTVGTGTPLLIFAGSLAAASLGGAAVMTTQLDPIAEAGEGHSNGTSTDYIGTAKIEQWNYKATVTTTPNMQTGACTKVTISQNCTKEKKNVCEEWGEEKEDKQTINLLD